MRGLRDLAVRLRDPGASHHGHHHPHGYDGFPPGMTAMEATDQARRLIAELHPDAPVAQHAAFEGLASLNGISGWGPRCGYGPLDADARQRIAAAIDALVAPHADRPDDGWLRELREAARLGLGRLCLLGLRQEVVRAADGVGSVRGFPGRGVGAALDALSQATYATVQDVAALGWIDATDTPEPARLAAAIDALQAVLSRKAARPGNPLPMPPSRDYGHHGRPYD